MNTPNSTYIVRDPQFGDCNPGSDYDPSVYQYYSDTCAIQSQKLILDKFGIHKTAEELIEDAKLHGWYAEGYGTPTEDVGKLLDLYGVENNASINNNIFSLANELAQHKQVIVSVDSNELWNREGFIGDMKDWFCGESPDHALIVAGLDTSDPDHVNVVLTDPGTGQLRVTYTEEEFMSAWKDSNCFMTTTAQAPEEFLGLDYMPEEHFAGMDTAQLGMLGNAELDMDTVATIVGEVAKGAIALAALIKSISVLSESVEGLQNSSEIPDADFGLGALDSNETTDSYLAHDVDDTSIDNSADYV